MNEYNKFDQKLTLIIPFLNEGDEVVNTIKSAYSFVGNSICFIIINDGSDDNYDYEKDLNTLGAFNIKYVINKKRIGVAASRDLAVSLCNTPYFLLLDAHMRFYNKEWLEAIVSILDLNDRRLLCCQTKVLWREDNGHITDALANETSISFGAYQPLAKNNLLPDITWNYEERLPGHDVEPIAAILGAGYAASKRYWNYLRGLEGLKLYGSDEAYISFKVWLEGGQCLLLKKQVIGHLYRKEAPYRIQTDEMIYNNLFISTLLFPSVLRSWAYAIACTLENGTYLKAYELLNSNTLQIEQLKQYFAQIFTVPFYQILDLHRFCERGAINALASREKYLPQIAHWLLVNVPETKGIMEGKAGLIIWFYHYARYNQDKINESVYCWLDEIEESILSHLLPLNFRHGLCGIGWLYMYLHMQKFHHCTNHNVLQIIDREVQMLSVKNLLDDGLDFGAGGILCYVVTRLRYAASMRESLDFSLEFSQQLADVSTRIITSATDLYACFYAFQYLDIQQNGAYEENWKPEVHEWMDYPTFLPEEEAYWKAGMRVGCSGYSLLYMIMRTKLLNTKNK